MEAPATLKTVGSAVYPIVTETDLKMRHWHIAEQMSGMTVAQASHHVSKR